MSGSGKVLETRDVDRVISAHERDVWARQYIGDLLNAHIGGQGYSLQFPQATRNLGGFL